MAFILKPAWLFLFAPLIVSAQTPGDGNGSPTPLPSTPLKASSVQCHTRIPQDFVPLSRIERDAIYVNSLIRPEQLAFTFARVGINQGLNRPHEWGQGWDGFGKRLASGYGIHAIDATFNFGIAWLRDEDNRYFNSGERGTRNRLWYAISSSFLARHDNGTRSISVSALAAPAAGAIISRAWQPPSLRSPEDAAITYAVSVGGHVAMNVAREFLPHSLRRRLP